ncbi:hypothetical protein [Yinghuangia soli]|uniref:Uncharacterized protein n=1 Tax=Yinghuangia soli TaxID=2908204 RepID=A0AA41TXX0_9ACTN|nr:hypothetical protein [Yinghuangia soli]MCF2527263.1 hypothetical protein [Yinghuangia soli]
MDETERPLPAELTLDEAYVAAYYMVTTYVEVEGDTPAEALVGLQRYLANDPGRWDDWTDAVRLGLANGKGVDPHDERAALRAVPECRAGGRGAAEHPLPARLTLEEAYLATFYVVDKYLERVPDSLDGDVAIFWMYLVTDPARWQDWAESVRRSAENDHGVVPRG